MNLTHPALRTSEEYSVGVQLRSRVDNCCVITNVRAGLMLSFILQASILLLRTALRKRDKRDSDMRRRRDMCKITATIMGS